MAPITDDLHEYEKLEREKAAVAADKAKLAQEREEMQKRQEELEKKMERLLSGGLNPMGMMGGMGMQDPMMMGMMNPMMMGMMNPMMMNPMMNPMMMGSMGGFNPMMNPMGMMNQMGNMGQGGMNPMMMGGMNPMMMGGMNPMMGQGMNPMMNAAQGGMGPGCPSINGMSGNGMYGVAGNSMHGGVAPSAAMNGTAWTVGQSDSKATTKKHKDTKVSRSWIVTEMAKYFSILWFLLCTDDPYSRRQFSLRLGDAVDEGAHGAQEGRRGRDQGGSCPVNLQ
jgi:hypothetical protein